MRIDLNQIAPNSVDRELKAKKAGGKAPSTPSLEDKASLSTDSLSVSSLEAQALALPDVRQEKVEALRNAIQNGQYKAEPEKIAHAILEHNKR
jgi:flagellar biosynthesis anti-sigma factor FlgM